MLTFVIDLPTDCEEVDTEASLCVRAIVAPRMRC